MNDETGEVLSITTLSGGDIIERVDEALALALDNCVDPDTPSKANRTVTVKLTAAPNEDRSMAEVSFSVDTKLASAKGGATHVLLATRPDGKPADASYHRFGEWMDVENFMIWLLTGFEVAAGDHDKVCKAAGNVTSEAVRTDTDDGTSQQVSVRRGAKVVLETVARTVTLHPYRTFPEVDQPPGLYVLRFRDAKADSPPLVSLHEVCNGQWQRAAMASVAEYLRPLVGDVPVVV